MDSRLESLILEAEWLAKQKPEDKHKRGRRVESLLVQIDKILKLDLVILKDTRQALTEATLFGLRHGKHYKHMLTAALSITTYITKYYACRDPTAMINYLVYCFVRLASTQKIEYIYDLSCISFTLQNLIIGNGLTSVLDKPDRARALLGVCERGFAYDTPEISPKLIKTILFRWPKKTGHLDKDQEYALEFRRFLKLILTKLHTEDMKNEQSRKYLLFSLVSALDTDHLALCDTFELVLASNDPAALTPEDHLLAYLTKWLEVATDEPCLATDLAIISCRALRRIIITPKQLRPWMFERVADKLVCKSIGILDRLIDRHRRLFSPNFNEEILFRVDPYDRLISDILFRFFTATRPDDAQWHHRLIGSIDGESEHRLKRIMDFVCSQTTFMVHSNGQTREITLEPHSRHFWSDFISEAHGLRRTKQTALIAFRTGPDNIVKRVKYEC